MTRTFQEKPREPRRRCAFACSPSTATLCMPAAPLVPKRTVSWPRGPALPYNSHLSHPCRKINIFRVYPHIYSPDLSICQIVNIPRTRLRHSGTKEGTDGNTRFSHGREEAGVSAFAFLGLLSDHRDIPSYAQVKGSRQRNRVFP